MPHRPILCVDFDGVVHSYTSGWHGPAVVMDPPVPGALAWLERAQGVFDVAIYSSRSVELGGIEAMRSWILSHAVHEWGDMDRVERLLDGLSFPTQKPSAFLTIDDRAIRFEGDFGVLDPKWLLGFQPWNKHDEPVRKTA